MKQLLILLLVSTQAVAQGLYISGSYYGSSVPIAPASPVPDIFWAKFNENAGTAFNDSSGHG